MNELKVGLLTLLAIASLVIVSIKITSNQAGFGDYVTYRAILNDATGIYEKSTIKVAGIVAGRIKAIELAGSQAVVTFEVLKSIKITPFSVLRIKTVGFLGDKYIDIYLGDPNAPRLEEGQYVKVEGGAGFEQLGKNAADVLDDVKKISQAIKEALYDKEQKNVIKGIMEDARAFAANAKDITESLKRVVNGNEGKLNESIKNLHKVAEQLAYETDRYADGSLMNDMEGIKPILANVRDATQDLKSIMADVKSGKGTVGRLLRDDEVVDQVNETLAGVNRIVNRINNFKTDLSIYTGYNTEFGGRTDLNMDIVPSPERFFKLGLVLSDYGPVNETETTTFTSNNGGAETEVNEREIDESEFKFNVQIGRKIGNWGLRAGLIETTGGIGVDYYIPHYGSTSFMEVFDYQEDAGPNVRLGTELRLWNVFYTKLMAEDVASKSGDQSYVISAGLKFTDDDLSALIGILAN
ncbi:MAG: MCE family protein [Bacteriovoracaceae bacterium]|nr:MCE family protein [Bacteriovoracaceae bacterium]